MCDGLSEIAFHESPITMRLRDEYDALGMLSYTGGQADLTPEDIKKIRGLLYAAGQAIESERHRAVAAESRLMDAVWDK